jgi:hypothetical protein
MSHSVLKQASRFKAMPDGEGGKNAPTSTQTGEFLKRGRRRRLDLKTLHGTMRESARVYRELAEGRIDLVEAETRSRVLRRHSEILTALEQRDQVTEIQRQLDALRNQPSAALQYQPEAELQSALPLAKTENDNPLIPETTQ